jgi:PAS domain S-box-containing protein
LFAAGAQEVLLIMAYQVLLVGLAFSLFLAVNQRLIAALELDIAQRRLVEQALRESEEKFALAFQTSPIGIAITRIEDSRFVEVNEAFCSITGFTREEVANHTPADFSLWVDEKRRSGVLSRILSGQKVVGEEFEFRKKNGQIATALFSADVLVLKNEKFMLSGAADITERKRMEEAIRVNAEKLARSNAELESFAYVVSHDLQEPLRMVASFAQLLSTRYFGKLDDTADRYIRYAVDGAKRMQQLITDLLAYSRVNTKNLDPRPTECEAVVRATLENLTASIEESGAVVDCGALPVLMADPVQLGQLFQNLIGNAIKFRGQAPPHVRISAADDGANWLFSVQDNGIGIEQRHADLIFQIFQRLHTREEYPGTGVGLAICKKVVERHGGTIWVESEPGAGSTFRFSLPISQEMVTSGATDEQSEETSGDTCGRRQPRRC